MKISLQIFSLLACAVLSSCGLKQSLDVQNSFSAEIHPVYQASNPLYLHGNSIVKVKRGIIPTEFMAYLPSGNYTPLAASKGRTYFLAPEKFAFRNGGNLQSSVGGLVETGRSGEYYVWYFPKGIPAYDRNTALSRKWIALSKPGLQNIEYRPWIEKDLLYKQN